jgi:hypothetical protein
MMSREARTRKGAAETIEAEEKSPPVPAS